MTKPVVKSVKFEVVQYADGTYGYTAYHPDDEWEIPYGQSKKTTQPVFDDMQDVFRRECAGEDLEGDDDEVA